jgi:hypothetical protein
VLAGGNVVVQNLPLDALNVDLRHRSHSGIYLQIYSCGYEVHRMHWGGARG